MRVRPKRIQDEHGLYVVCGNCGNRLATLILDGKIIDESIPYQCNVCGAIVDNSDELDVDGQ